MDHPLLILSDAHLSKDYGSEISCGLAEILPRFRDTEIVLAGDIFDLSLDSADTDPTASLEAAVAPHGAALDALRIHVKGGGRITFVPGNHDASLSHPKAKARLRSLLCAPDERTVDINPWFLRRDGIHIEHGHLYDPDCAPNHPLAEPNPRSEGLGTALMRRFVAPNDALFFAHANQTTLASGLKTAFDRWGHRAPAVIVDYFKTAIDLCLEALTNKDAILAERSAGDLSVSEYAKKSGVPIPVIEALLRTAPAPTHHSFRSMFLRLYFDRVFAICSLATGLGLLGGAGLGLAAGTSLINPLGALTVTGSLLAAVGGGYLTANTAIQKNRYGDQVIGQLHRGAALVREITACDLVVFGHTHVEVNEPAYVNLGSFGFGRKRRPYLLIDRQGRPERSYHPAG